MEKSKLFSTQKYINLETYRKNGRAVTTTVWLVEDGGVVYVRTSDKTGKYKRIQNNPHVRLAPSNYSGTTKGEWVEGDAREVEGAEAERILRLFSKKYGVSLKTSTAYNWIRGRRPRTIISIKILAEVA
jgi:PPOX class probable F420-dependent enzyme